MQRSRIVGDLWTVSRPPLWMVSLLPFYIGYVLATRHIVPETLSGVWPPLVGAIALGPVAWLAVLAINDAYDLPGDLGNPRKADFPLVSGRLSVRDAKLAAYVAAAVALAAALAINVAFALLTLGFLALGWAYSIPLLRFKDRPGFDVVTNALAIGGFTVLGGWAVARPLDGFPLAMLAEGILVLAALYIPTTLVDYDADVSHGYKTIAVSLGYETAYRIGLAAWVACCALAVTLSAFDHVIPRRMLWIQIVSAPILVGTYHLLIGRTREPGKLIRGIIITSFVFLAVNTVFALMYVGLI